jgi:hypothetical protein
LEAPDAAAADSASASRRCDEWKNDDYDVLANREAVGRIYTANAAPIGSPWMWTLIFPHYETREIAMVAFAKSWRRE